MENKELIMRKLFCLLVFLPLFLFAQQPSSNGVVVKHTYYSLSYIEEHEQPEWVYYLLTADMVNGNAERGDDFRPDAKVKTGSAELSDYKSSGYDRGHLCPAADMKQSDEAMSETFYMSNMSPQKPSFNRGVWARLEQKVRDWALADDSLYVVTGPVFIENIGTIGANKVTIPGFYYKVLYSPKRSKMQAFLLPNCDGLKADWEVYSVSVDLLEWLTGIDFYAAMADDVEANLEGVNDYDSWSSDASKRVEKQQVTTTAKGTSQQCKGIAKSTGQRCKTRTTNANGYCDAHQYQVPK